MSLPHRRPLCLVLSVLVSLLAHAQAKPNRKLDRAPERCSRPAVGSTVSDDYSLRSRNRILKVDLKLRNSLDPSGYMRYCYVDQQGHQAPTLRVHPGDMLILTLANEISLPDAVSKSFPGGQSEEHPRPNHDPCEGGPITPSSTNLHFHGIAAPPSCHQDETLMTVIQPRQRFEYRIQIPRNQPPGLYWYHPHIHGFTEEQVLGGASGALVVEGMERVVPQVAGLPERVFVICDEKMPDSKPGDPPDPNRPTKQLSINSIAVPYPKYSPAIIQMKPLQRQFWRVLNAAADTYLDLRVEFDGKPQNLSVVSLDGFPLGYARSGSLDPVRQQTHIFLPPAARAEFIFTGPPPGVSGKLITNYVYRGAEDDDGIPLPVNSSQPAARVGQDDVDPTRPLAMIVTSAGFTTPHSLPPAKPGIIEKPGASLAALRPVRTRTLYFSERLVNPDDPKSATIFFITEEGHTPAVFNPHTAEPGITVSQGDIEDWIIENRSQESHTFHIHQLHFLVVGARGGPWEGPSMRDTVNVPAWDGISPVYPSVKLRMDFRNPNIIGIFPFHCHILQHTDGGMMGTLRVTPAPEKQKKQ